MTGLGHAVPNNHKRKQDTMATKVSYHVDRIVTEGRTIVIDPDHFLEVMNIPLTEVTALGREVEIYALRTGRKISTHSIREQEVYGRTRMEEVETPAPRELSYEERHTPDRDVVWRSQRVHVGTTLENQVTFDFHDNTWWVSLEGLESKAPYTRPDFGMLAEPHFPLIEVTD